MFFLCFLRSAGLDALWSQNSQPNAFGSAWSSICQFAVLPRLVPCQNSFGLEPATALPALIIFHIFFFWGTVQVEIGISQPGVHHVLKIEDVLRCDIFQSRPKTVEDRGYFEVRSLPKSIEN